MPEPTSRILFIELLGGVGDLLIALPAIQAIARSHPRSAVTVCTFAPGATLLRHDPLIARVVPVARGEARRAVEALLASGVFDVVVSDTCYDDIDRLVAGSGARHIVANLWRDPPPDEPVGERFLRILGEERLITPESVRPARLHLTAAERERTRALRDGMEHESAGPTAPRALVVLLPEAGMAIKQWPVAHFVQLGRALRDEHAAQLLVPTGLDTALARCVAEGIGADARVCEATSLRDLAAVLAAADLVVGGDTGPARIAAALGVPTITLFGPSWHGRYGHPMPHVNLQGHPGCPERVVRDFTAQRCWWSGRCPIATWRTCLDAIAPEAVLSAAVSVLTAPHTVRAEAHATAPVRVLHRTEPRLRRDTLDPAWAAARRVLAVRLDNAGDVVMTGPALRAVKAGLPDAHVTLLASPAGADAAVLLPWVDDVLVRRALWQAVGRRPFDPGAEWALIDTLRAGAFDAAILFTSFSQSPHPAALACALAGIPLRLGETKEGGHGALTTEVASAPDEIHQVERNLGLIEAAGFAVHDRSLGIEIPGPAARTAAALLSGRGVASGSPYVLLNPCASASARTYAADRFAAAAHQLAHETGWPVVITGTARDRPRADAVLGAIGDNVIDVVGRTTLAELAALVAAARLVLTGNTSTMHLADATRTPSVVLFAGTELESQWRPRHSPARLLRRPTPCAPCYAFDCPLGHECLDIGPEAVVTAALAVLAEQAGRGGAGG